MANAIDRFLDDLTLEASRRLSSEQGLQLLDEVKTHLDEELRARLEYGLPEDDAARQAVLSFGSPTEVVNGVAFVKEESPATWHSVPFFKVAIAATATSAFCLAVSLSLPDRGAGLQSVVLAQMIAFGIWLFRLGCKARRIQPLSLAAVFAFATFAVGTIGAWNYTHDDTFGPGFARSSIQSQINSFQYEVVEADKRLTNFDAAYKIYLEGSNKLAPSQIKLGSASKGLLYEPIGSLKPTAIDERWRNAVEQWRPGQQSIKESASGTIDILQAKLARPWYKAIPTAAQHEMLDAVYWTLLLFAVNTFAGFCRLASDTTRKRLLWNKVKA